MTFQNKDLSQHLRNHRSILTGGVSTKFGSGNFSNGSRILNLLDIQFPGQAPITDDDHFKSVKPFKRFKDEPKSLPKRQKQRYQVCVDADESGVFEVPILRSKGHFRAASTNVCNPDINESLVSLSLKMHHVSNNQEEMIRDKINNFQQRAKHLINSFPQSHQLEALNKKKDFIKQYNLKIKDFQSLKSNTINQISTEQSNRIISEEGLIQNEGNQNQFYTTHDDIKNSLKQSLLQQQIPNESVNFEKFQQVMNQKEKVVFNHKKERLSLKNKFIPTKGQEKQEAQLKKKINMAQALVTSLIGPQTNRRPYQSINATLKNCQTTEKSADANPNPFRSSLKIILKDQSTKKHEQFQRQSVTKLDLYSISSGQINAESTKQLEQTIQPMKFDILSHAMNQELTALRSTKLLAAREGNDYLQQPENKSLRMLDELSRNSILRIESSQRIASVASMKSITSSNHNVHKSPYKKKDLNDLRLTIEHRLVKDLKDGSMSPKTYRNHGQSPSRSSMLKILTDKSRVKVEDKLTNILKQNAEDYENTSSKRDYRSSDQTYSMQKIKYRENFQKVESQTLIAYRLQQGMPPLKKFKFETTKGNEDLKQLFKEEKVLEKHEMKGRQFKRPKKVVTQTSASVDLKKSSLNYDNIQDPQQEQNRRQLVRLFNYQVEQLEQEAMFSPKEQDKLRFYLHTQNKRQFQKLLKAHKEKPLRNNFKTFTELEEEVTLVEDEEEIKRQCLYAFKNHDGSLKTCNSLQKMIDEETEIIRFIKAANQPKIGNITNENIAKMIFQKDQLSHFNQEFDICIQIDPENIQLSPQAATALLIRKQSAKDEQKLKFAKEVTDYVLELNQNNEQFDLPLRSYQENYSLLVDHSEFLPKISSFKENGEQKQRMSTVVADKLLNKYGVKVEHAITKDMLKQRHSPTKDVIKDKIQKIQSLEPPLLIKRGSNMEAKQRLQRSSTYKVSVLETGIEKFSEQAEKHFDWDNIANKLIEQMVFNDVCKQTGGASIAINFKDPRYQYFIKCKEAIEPVLSILQKIQESQLSLQGYNISNGQCKGIAKACEFDARLFKNLFIDNCNMTDESLAVILDGAIHLESFKSLVYRKNELGLLSVAKMTNLFPRFFPKNLEELRIEQCKMSLKSIQMLLKNLIEQNYIKRFALVGMGLDSTCVGLIVTFLQTAKYLNDFDLSWTKTLPGLLEPILVELAENRKIKSINLSWNNLVEAVQTPCQLGTYQDNIFEQEESDFLQTQDSIKSNMHQSFVSQGDTERRKTYGLGKIFQTSQNLKKELPKDVEKVISGYICKLIDKNRKLQHLDISNTGMSCKILSEISRAILGSTSLLAIHLSGNPGVDEKTTKKLISRLKATWELPIMKQNFNQFLYDSQKTQCVENEPENEINIKQTLTCKKIGQQKEQLAPFEHGKMSDTNNQHLIFTRVLGHQLEMPGQEQWLVHKTNSKECWVCDRKMFTFIIWSPEFGEQETQEIKLSLKQKQKVIQNIFANRETNLDRQNNRQIDKRLMTPEKKFQVNTNVQEVNSDEELDVSDESIHFSDMTSSSNDEIFEKQEEQLPEITLPDMHIEEQSSNYNSSSQSNSKHFKFSKSHQSSKLSIQKDQKYMKVGIPVGFTGKMRNLPMISGNFNNWQAQPMIKINNYAEVQDTSMPPDIMAECKAIKKLRQRITSVDEMTSREREFYESRVENARMRYHQIEIWGKILKKNLKFKNPVLLGLKHAMEQSSKQLYFSCVLMDAGKNNFLVHHKTKCYMHQATVGVRTELIPDLTTLDYNAGKVARFPNVFKSWHVDTEDTLRKCYEYDFENWRFDESFKREGTVELELVKMEIIKNYSFLKQLFLTLACELRFPFISQSTFDRFLTENKIYDADINNSFLQSTIISVLFVSENKGRGKLYNQAKQELNRFQFIDILLRISLIKFKDNGNCESMAEAFKQLIQHLMSNALLCDWQGFRQEVLWTREVNLLLDANLEALKELYQLKASKMGKMPFDSAIKLFTTETSFKMSTIDAISCYALSLMTCPDLHTLSQLKQFHIDFVEFLEMIGRVAEVQFFNSDYENQSLEQKLHYVLDELLKLINANVVEPELFEVLGDDSDELENKMPGLKRLDMKRETKVRYD